jgi:hypothetical protein
MSRNKVGLRGFSNKEGFGRHGILFHLKDGHVGLEQILGFRGNEISHKRFMHKLLHIKMFLG